MYAGVNFDVIGCISKTRTRPGVKLAPFNSGGVCQNCPAKTDDALQQIVISGQYFSPNCWL